MKISFVFSTAIFLFMTLGCGYFKGNIKDSKPLVSDQTLQERFERQKSDFMQLAKILEKENWQNNTALIKEMDEIEKKIGANSSSLHSKSHGRLDVFLAGIELKDSGECTDFMAEKGYYYSKETAATLAEKGSTTHDGKTEFKPLGENWHIYFRPSVPHHSTERCGKE